MENFVVFNPTRLHFGKGVLSNLNTAILEYGKNVLLVTGKGSVKKSGLYNDILTQVDAAGAQIYKYEGIKSNPVVDDVDKAAKLGREKNVDVIIAAGGGSVIDSAKIIAMAIKANCSGWDIMKGKVKPEAAVPLIAILTLAATGTEMNPVAVLQNPKTLEKIGYGNPLVYPAHSFLDPSFTLTVPLNYTAFGIVDLIAHSLEAWFGEGDASLSDRFVLAIIQEALEYGPQLMNKLGDYDLRARIMWAATNALNGLTSFGRKSGDWGVHGIGHTLSVLYDVPHGASLSIVYPAWMRLVGERDPERIFDLGNRLFGVTGVGDTIQKFEAFFHELGSPIRMSEVGIPNQEHANIANLMEKNGITGTHHKLSGNDYKALVKFMA